MSKSRKEPRKPAKRKPPAFVSSGAPRFREKIVWKPGNLVSPAPAALVSSGKPPARPNLATVAWCANVNSEPPMLSISLRPSRLTHEIVSREGEFVVNIPSLHEERAVDYCGVASGRKVDKFAKLGLTPQAVPGVEVPAVGECPIAVACRVDRVIPLGSHDLFLARIVSVAVDAGLVDRRGALSLERAELLCFAHGFYHALGRRRGGFGWSVRGRK